MMCASSSTSSTSSSSSGGRSKRYANERGVADRGRHPDLRGPRQRRRLGAPGAVPPRRGRPRRPSWPACRPTTSAPPASSGATRSTAGTCWPRRLRLVGRALPQRSAACRHRADRPLPRLRGLLGGAGQRGTDGRQRSLGARARARPFFQAVREALGELPIIAEDLGVITPDVVEIRDERWASPACACCSSPSARRDRRHDPYLPHNFDAQHGGLHRHPRQRHHGGWYNTASAQEQVNVRHYLVWTTAAT